MSLRDDANWHHSWTQSTLVIIVHMPDLDEASVPHVISQCSVDFRHVRARCLENQLRPYIMEQRLSIQKCRCILFVLQRVRLHCPASSLTWDWVLIQSSLCMITSVPVEGYYFHTLGNCNLTGQEKQPVLYLCH